MNKIRCYISIWICLMFMACSSRQTNIQLVNVEKNSVIDFAINDMDLLLSKNRNNKLVSMYKYKIIKNDSLKNGAFSCKNIGNNTIEISGADDMSISHAVYLWLECLGYVFDFSETYIPDSINFELLSEIDTLVVPDVRWRGIRQHVNFPMDISSYPINEAKKYLENLVRLKFNKLAIHSYPGIWYEEHLNDSLIYGGNFYYSNTQYFNDNPILKQKIRYNDSIFSIPEVEKVYHDNKLRSQFAVSWMSELLEYAKRIGLNIQFSFEPRSKDFLETVNIAKNIVKTYPMIDELELITEELGGWGSSCSKDEILGIINSNFGNDLLNDDYIKSWISESQVDLDKLFMQIGTITKAIGILENDSEFVKRIKDLKLGIYCTTRYINVAYYLARKVLPDNNITIMPSHGSDGVANAIVDLINTDFFDINKTEIYSWIEFDGLMYLQQNAINGIYKLSYTLNNKYPDKQIQSICYNHWRTSENRITSRYVSDVTIDSGLSPEKFYCDYGNKIGICDVDYFKNAMFLLNEVDSYSTVNLGNIGFCWDGAWSHDGLFSWMNIGNINTAIDKYIKIGKLLNKIKCENTYSKYCIDYLSNRVYSSILYLEAFRKMAGIRNLKHDNDIISPLDCAKLCDESLFLFNRYIDYYSKMLYDRGSEGTIVSVWNAPMKGIRKIKNKVDEKFDISQLEEKVSKDAPPLPILF